MTTSPAIVSKTYDSAGVSLVLTIPRLLALERKMQGWKPDNKRHERDVRAIGKNVQLTTLSAIVSKQR
ncbi:hypothetical protein FHS57_000786 [Runella defluvii]|uniref:Uncharacterized protein n=1 Tax=Runella defluvii TaxID=370973 RepID=A0A7W6ENS2_9BACT|nr:hypothetical protein [Runella defluvii]MBB3836804.1 hypothetical protein [Runella defluvii]